MGRQERQLKEFRALRDAAHAVFRADLDLVRTEFAPDSLTERIKGRVAEKAADVSDSAVEAAKRHRGALVGGAAALAGGALLWLARAPLGAAFAALRNKFGNGDEGQDEGGQQEETA